MTKDQNWLIKNTGHFQARFGIANPMQVDSNALIEMSLKSYVMNVKGTLFTNIRIGRKIWKEYEGITHNNAFVDSVGPIDSQAYMEVKIKQLTEMMSKLSGVQLDNSWSRTISPE